jgi:hypothetical protein
MSEIEPTTSAHGEPPMVDLSTITPGAVDRVVPDDEAGFELSIVDALMLVRVSATRPGLRARLSNTAPAPTMPLTSSKESA